MIAGSEAKNFGEAKNSWLTGTAAWTFVNVSQYLLGIKPDFSGLRVDPCIPADFPGFSVRRTYRGVTYEIEVKNPNHAQKGVESLTVDGKTVDGNLIPYDPAKKLVKVTAVLG